MTSFKTIIIAVITAILSFYSASILAQEIKDTLILKETVVTGSRTAQLQGSITQKIEVLSKKEIEATVAFNRNIADVLFNRPGNSVSVLSRNDANWGTFGGIGPKYSTFMLQGLPIDAFIDPMTLDLSAIDRIEIQRGPASVIYSNYLSQDFAGNQSPLAGTVNLILKEKFTAPSTRFASSYGSYNTFNNQFYHQNVSNGINYYFGLNNEISDYTDYGIPNSWLNMKKNPEYRKTKAFGGLTWFSDDQNQKFTLFINKTFHKGDAGRVYRGFDHNYGIVNAGYTLKFNNNITFQAHAGWRNYDRSWQESHFNIIDSLDSENGVIQNIIPADAQINIKHGEKNNLTAGIDYQGAEYYTWSDPLQGFRSYGNKSRAWQSGFYVQEEAHFGKLIARGGIRYNFTKTNIALINGGAPGEPSKVWSKLLYSAGLRYNASKKVSLFANAGTSFMTPGLKSVGGTIKTGDTLHSGQLPNPDLKPESGFGIDFGADLALMENFVLSARLFNLQVTDAIIDNVVRQNPSQSQSINAGKTNSKGGELELKIKMKNYLEAFANLTYMKTVVNNEFDADQDGGTVPFSPELIINAGASFTAPFGLQITPMLNYNGGYYDNTSISSRNEFVPGILLNVFVSQEILKNDKSKVSLFGQFYNITDNEYEMPWQFKNTGFSFQAGLNAEF
ncbi:MAG: TonB-dependent receptor [Sphingobacteriales bacterium]|nr:TonB-dependent receptor [Sphingobacteriales bacterium]